MLTPTKRLAARRTKPTPAGTTASNPLSDETIIAGIDAQVASEGWQKVDSEAGAVVIYIVAMITETEINSLALMEHGAAWDF